MIGSFVNSTNRIDARILLHNTFFNLMTILILKNRKAVE